MTPSQPAHSPQTWGFGGLLLLLLLGWATPALAFKAPKLPNRGAPGTAKAGASRDLCRILPQPLTAIVPVEKSTGVVGGLSVTAQPSLWFLNPYRLGLVTEQGKETDCGKLEFILRDDQQKEVYRESYSPGVGFFGIKLPEKAKLQGDRSYHWTLIARIPNKPATTVDGWVQRVAPPPQLQAQLKQAKTPADQAAAYSAAEIWHEALEPLCRVTDAKTGAVADSCDALMGVLLRGGILFPTDE
jgi:Domain of Unknown Function (DUF928)